LSETVAVLGAGRIGRQIALAFALGGCRVRLLDVKPQRSVAEARRVLADARREIARDLGLMVEERVLAEPASALVLQRIEDRILTVQFEEKGSHAQAQIEINQ
jgi:3-hydroxyacyl-CoA dehydrogenase